MDPAMSDTRFEDNNDYVSETYTGLDISQQTLEGIEFDGCNFRSCDFTETTFKHCKFIDCDFEQCNLSNCKLGYSKFSDVSFKGSKLIGIDWNQATWPSFSMPASIRFDQCIINNSSFSGMDMESLHLNECKAHEVDFREAKLSESDFRFTDFSYSQFSKTDLSEADFSDAFNYDINIFSNNIKGAKFSRIEAVSLLEGIGIELVD